MVPMAVLVYVSLLFSVSYSSTFVITNNCPFTIWPGTLSGSGTRPLPTTGFRLDVGQSVKIPSVLGWSGRIWARTGCKFDANGAGKCVTGDCGGKLECAVGGPLVQARNFAAITGVNAGIACVMKRIRGKEDLESAVVAAFGSGVAYSLVSAGLQGQPMNAITTAAGFSLFQGIFFKLGERFSKPSVEDPYYTRARSMLLKLGLEKYEKNFKKGLLADPTLPLLTDSALKDVSIPPGPRLLILDHIQRDPELKGKRGSRG
ncbi:hypothetical protein F2Q70_00032395 [Brassica cretica]|uniref:SAM domain-containing protein n=1 Tax=Brassica cretica TaxID=69181 RepID=A0A8S9FNW3_BRACR|nr:hypothetical protein F2Q70_00032395 [Brassica cretica]